MRKKTTKEFIESAKRIHGDKYDYSKVEYVNNLTKVCIICPEHGEFWQTPSNHINGNRPRGCPVCGIIETNRKNTYTLDEFIGKARKVHGDKYDYSKVEYNGSTSKVCIICPEHGEFWQTPSSHLVGCGCPYCSGNAKDDSKTFIEKAENIHCGKYDYSSVEYVNSQTPVKIICPIHGEFTQLPNNHLSKRYGCPKCSHIISKKEEELYDFICSTVGKENVIQHTRDVISPLELDIYIPSLSIAVEFDGIRWHSEEFEKSKTYHLDKTRMCEDKGIRLIHIFEDEWDFKKDIIKGMMTSKFNKNEKIYARKCTIREITNREAKDFINKNHIQGYVNSKVSIGLFHENELCSVMTFGKERINLGRKGTEGCYEMLRFASRIGITVVGGASKMFSYFTGKYKPEHIVTYADLRFFDGHSYENLGFKFSHKSKPNYFYVIRNHRENRFKYRKDRLVSEGFDKNKTEHQIMFERGIYRIYDCGCNVYEWKNLDS